MAEFLFVVSASWPRERMLRRLTPQRTGMVGIGTVRGMGMAKIAMFLASDGWLDG
jgi:hypothetical protein